MSACPMCSKWIEDADLQIVELEQCHVLLNRDQFFAGYCFVFTKNHVIELFHLDQPTRQAVIEEVNRVAEALAAVFKPTKINYELLGNMVPHMHWHLVPRFKDDALWPKPIWAEEHEEVHLSKAEYKKKVELIRGELQSQVKG